jgi:hypothetical protein
VSLFCGYKFPGALAIFFSIRQSCHGSQQAHDQHAELNPISRGKTDFLTRLFRPTLKHQGSDQTRCGADQGTKK